MSKDHAGTHQPPKMYFLTGTLCNNCSKVTYQIRNDSTIILPMWYISLEWPLYQTSFPWFSLHEIAEPKKTITKSRRYQPPPPQLLRIRRSAANERERRRMNTLNVAYDKLRTVLPEMDSGRRLSKYETLQMAQQYIACLMEILGESSEKQSPEKN
ncbi:unnamed protein product [Cylicocyclus nassatus]|uniref:BHLH domain-containing protein n=1 Tax=Cylicocyclus nassatus TaxID=53992 RepID=A0AA36HCY3_CYLNA|nr:unnamed protein product [Cylicocyclus nassatus]